MELNKLYGFIEMDLPGDSDSDEEEGPSVPTDTEAVPGKGLARKVKKLEAQLKEARDAVHQMRQLVQGRLNLLEPGSDGPAAPQPRDDDSHYFNSYAYNGNSVLFTTNP